MQGSTQQSPQMYLVGDEQAGLAERQLGHTSSVRSDDDGTTLAGSASTPGATGVHPEGDGKGGLHKEDRPTVQSLSSTRHIPASDMAELHRQLSRIETGRTGRTSASAYNPKSDNFELERYLKQVFREREEAGLLAREATVVFEDLCVDGVGSGVNFGETVGSIFGAPLRGGGKAPVKYILQNFTGAVKSGEMLLVLGRPGSGCTSFLKTLGNQTASFSEVRGDLSYSGITPAEMLAHHAGDVAYLAEDDKHLPILTVDQTLDFAASARVPAKQGRTGGRREYADALKNVLLAIFGLRSTVDTRVGDDYIRGISGGQRKRVSIAENMLTRARVICHDNATRGLDSSTSLEYVQALRVQSDITNITTIVSLYQCGQPLYEIFDKVCLIYEGRQIYYGPRDKAFDYFYELGYEPQLRQTTPDFLCSITDPKARLVRKNFEGSRPRTSEDFARVWIESDLGKANAKEVADVKASFSEEHQQNYRSSAKAERVKGIGFKASPKTKKSGNPYVLSYWQQTKLCVRRRVQLALGDLPSLLIPIAAYIIQAIIIGSTFYRITNANTGFFSRGGVLFFSVFFNALQALSEITTAFSQRPVVVRQRGFAMVHPSCDALAQLLVDIPVKFVTVLIFDIIIYFFSNLSTALASQFFVFLLFTYLISLTMITFFRMVAALCSNEADATTIGSVGILSFLIYTGYALPRPDMRVYFRWISYANPVSFAFESVLSNEFRTRTATPCANLIPPGAPLANQVCPVPGAIPGSATVDATLYLDLAFGYSYSNVWRNLGIVLSFWVVFIVGLALATEKQADLGAKPSIMLFKRGKGSEDVKALIEAKAGDEETLNSATGPRIEDAHDGKAQDDAANQLEAASDVFMWKGVTYKVPTKDGDRTLLDNVNGFVVPGKLTALMGESGAGKTTLLNVLAQRVTMGTITGDMLVNGRPLPASFQRQTGYCQQQDVHLPTTTVREALEFSALLRQPKSTPKKEKLAYVDNVIKMLEMESFENALVGEVGEGLNVEQRKRLTVGVELAARPALLVFADEPTSGLDSQSAWSIVQFLRKLADHGQAILCTIHQPSSELFQVFDRLLLLKKGGKTVYFGDIGKNSRTLIDYFESHGAKKCGEEANPAEYILECVGAGATAKVSEDWGDIWQKSEERKVVDKELERLVNEYKGKKSQADDAPDAGRKYAAGFGTQLSVVTKRIFQNYWRDPVYFFGKLSNNILAGLYIGFSFFMPKDTQAGLQVYMFSVFMAVVICFPLAQQIQPKFIQLRSLYEVRERPSRMYNLYVQAAASIVVEMPWNFLTGSIFWCCWYFAVGGQTGERAIYSFITYTVAFETYWSTFAQAIAVVSPNAQIASVIFSSLFAFVIVFNGVLQPPAQLPGFWRSWMFPLSPFRWLIGGLLSNQLGGLEFRCRDQEVTFATPPAGAGTCSDFLGDFVAASTGFITNPDATGVPCGYCQYATGDEYLNTLETAFSQRWRNMGIVFGYVAFNILMVFLLMSLRYVDLPKFSFGGRGTKSVEHAEDATSEPEHPVAKQEKEAGTEIV